MRIIKNLRDMSLNEDEKFFADIIKDEFGWNTCVEKIKNKDFLQRYVKPLHDFNIYTTAQPTAEGMRMIAWKRRNFG
ncbi:MAG: hypothetical protein KHX03_04140 [Clostridium sp.]|nr:hypothetical protein [Clostridium sp.]